MTKIRCPKCGHKLHGEDKFCPECGAKVPPRARRRHTFPWGCAFVTLLLMGALCVAGYYVYDFKAMKDREMTAYAALSGCEDVERYNDFIARFPESHHIAEVRSRMEALKEEQGAFASLLASRDAHSLRRYLIDNPTTARRAQIEAVLDTVEYHDATAAASIEALDEYIATHPQSPFLDIARSRLKELRRTTVTPEERMRLRRVVDRFASAMNNGDDGALAYLMASRFESFNGRDTTLTNFNHDIMVYVNERLFHEDETLSLCALDDMAIRKLPMTDSDDYLFEVSVSLAIGRYEDDEWTPTEPTRRLSGRLIGSGQFITLDIR